MKKSKTKNRKQQATVNNQKSVSFFGTPNPKFRVNCNDAHNTIIFTNDIESERVQQYAVSGAYAEEL